jgi:putative ABC transport system ATP-binding protein
VTRAYQSVGDDAAGIFNVSATIAAGSFVAVTGPSGSGKSTLLNLIAALDRPDHGRVVVDGRDIATADDRAQTAYRLNTVGCLFQDAPLIGELSIRNNVALPGLLRGEGRRVVADRALALLERVGLATKSDAFPGELSVGQRQRAGLARALCNHPSLLLADEPTGNLDRSSGRVVMELIGEARLDGCTVVVVTHDPEIAASAEWELRLTDGRVDTRS